MIGNHYLRRLLRNYREVVLDEHKIDEIAEKTATLTPEAVGVKEKDLNKAATRVEEALKELGIDPNHMSGEELMRFLLGLYKNFGAVPNTISAETLEKSAVVLAEELKRLESNHSGYRYGRRNRQFSSIKNFSKLTMAIAMIPVFLSTLVGGKLNAAEIISQMANNPKAVEAVVEKTVLENITSEDSIIRYRKGVKPEKSLMETIKPALEEIKKAGGTSLYEHYNRFLEAGALTPLPQKDTLEPSTRIALRLYKSAKIMYNKFRGKDAVSFDTLLSNEKTEIATQHIVFAAISYNILDQLYYKAHDLSPDQIKQLKQELRAGKYEVKFKNNKIVINTLNDTLDLEFIITLHEIQVMGIDHAHKILANNQYYDILIRNLNTYKSTIAPVERTVLYDIYVVLPVIVQEGTMHPIHEVAFRIRCSLEVYSYVKDASGISLVRPTISMSQFRNKNKRLFGKKKKYEWM